MSFYFWKSFFDSNPNVSPLSDIGLHKWARISKNVSKASTPRASGATSAQVLARCGGRHEAADCESREESGARTASSEATARRATRAHTAL